MTSSPQFGSAAAPTPALSPVAAPPPATGYAGRDLAEESGAVEDAEFVSLRDVAEKSANTYRKHAAIAAIVSAYCLWTSIAVHDSDLVTDNWHQNFGELHLGMKLSHFFGLAPMVVCIAQLAMMLQLGRLCTILVHLPAVFPNGMTIDYVGYPLEIGGLFVPQSRGRDRMKGDALHVLWFWFGMLGVWAFPTVAIVLMWGQYLPKQDRLIGTWVGFAAALSTAIAVVGVRGVMLRIRDQWDSGMASAAPVSQSPTAGVAAPSAVGCIGVPAAPAGCAGSHGTSQARRWGVYFGLATFAVLAGATQLLAFHPLTVMVPGTGNYLVDSRARLEGLQLPEPLPPETARSTSALGRVRGARLAGARLRGAMAERVVLIGADLRRATLRGANFNGADLRNAELTQADLRSTSLVGADLRCANLWGVDFDGADLRGAIVDAWNVEDKSVRKAKNWQQAYYPTRLRKGLGLPADHNAALREKLAHDEQRAGRRPGQAELSTIRALDAADGATPVCAELP